MWKHLHSLLAHGSVDHGHVIQQNCAIKMGLVRSVRYVAESDLNMD